MRSVQLVVGVIVAAAGALRTAGASPAAAGSGDLSHIDYWRTKVAFVQIDEAVKTGQPGAVLEPATRGFLTSLDAADKLFPGNPNLAKWRARVQEIRKALAAAPVTPGGWKKDFAWAYTNFTMAWANYHCGKMLMAEGTLQEANARLHFAVVQFRLLGKSSDNFPDDLKTWLAAARPEAEKLDEELEAKLAGKTLGDPFAGKRTKTGDISKIEYWRAKATMTMLEDAVRTEQPAREIDLSSAAFLRDCTELLTTIPDHVDIPKWKARTEAIRAALGERTVGGWKPGFPWANGNYERAWANYYSGKMSLAEGNLKEAVERLQFAVTQFQGTSAIRGTFYEETQKWIAEAEPDCKKLYAEARDKLKAKIAADREAKRKKSQGQ